MTFKKSLLTFILLILFSKIHAASTVDFFATKSSSKDTNMITMTTDLFFTQFTSMAGYTVFDRRDTVYEKGIDSSSNIIFYSEIEESGDGNWVCTLNVINSSKNKNLNITKTYASYYKILLDAKTSLENLLTSLEGNAAPEVVQEPPKQNQSPSKANIEELAGTWTGESLIDKIVILRGGKGFVIFKNGATMNIAVSTEGSNVVIKQTGKPNASFFPELPRDLALKNVMNAQPVLWTLSLLDSQTLSGNKTTLIEDASSENGVSEGNLQVEWKKK